ncbi:MAG: murein biosynthesis integral membrane protein MurJ [Actinomycetota bacterium]|nr:murein biosynthesis integral membrane protein MurJ [Actinomycetota bacterium]
MADDATTPGPAETGAPAATPVSERPVRRLALSTAIFSFATGISRLLGLVREVVAKNYFGVQGPVNAFQIAFLVPNTIRALVADAALSSAFVPVFSDLIEKGERKRAWRVASTLFWLTLLGLGALTALFVLVAPWVMPPLYPHYHPLLVGLSQVLFPIVALLGVSGVVVGILNTYDEFSIPALTPVAWNLVIIAGLVFGVPHVHGADHKLYVYAGSILAGTVVQVLLPIPWLRGKDGQLRLVIDWRDPAVKQIFKLMLPVTLGLGLININALIDGVVGGWLVTSNAPSEIDAAFRIYMLPQGMFSVAVATVLFPSLARFAARGDMQGFRSTAELGLRQIAFLLVPASVVSAVLAEPITRLIYQRGAFTPGQTPIVAACLAALSLGLAFNGTMLMLNRAFFSLQENWLPTSVALANLFVNLILDIAFSPLGTWGIPLATSLVNIAGTVALLALLRRRLGRIGFGEIAASFVRIVGAAAVAGGIAFAVWKVLDDLVGRSLGGQLLSLVPALTAATVAYLAAGKLLRVREMQALLSLRSRPRRG